MKLKLLNLITKKSSDSSTGSSAVVVGSRHGILRFSKTSLIVVALFSGLAGSYFIYNSFAATATCSSASFYNGAIVYNFDQAYCGQFANGDWWVAPIAPATSVRITAISPAFSGGQNGWEVNPVYSGGQGFDIDVEGYNAALVPALPYSAQPNQSIVKATSAGTSCPNNIGCLQTAAVLTVLGSPPADGTGAGYLRPPYVGTTKPLIPISQLQTDLLPSLAPPSGYTPPSISAHAAEISKLQLDHKDGLPNRNLHPIDNMPDYGASIAANINGSTGRLMFNDSLANKMPLLIHVVQGGLDRYHMSLMGMKWTQGGPGHNMGRKLSITFAALMVNDAAMINEVKTNPTFGQFHEDTGIRIGKNNVALFGGFEFDRGEKAYWDYLAAGGDSSEDPDPYGWIDGGTKNGGINSYQFCCTAQPWKGAATMLHLVPELQSLWQNQATIRSYADRWVTKGAHYQPDPCAPVGAAEGWGPDTTKPGDCKRDTDWDNAANACRAGGTCGRYPSLHGTAVDGGYYSSEVINQLWKAYRGTIPATPPAPAPSVTISASPTSLTTGSSSILTWSSANVTSCTASSAWSGAKAISGTESTGAISTAGSKTYTLACTGTAGSANASATVTVTDPPPPPAAGTYTFWPSTTVPGTASSTDSQAVEVGVKFRSSTAGNVTGVKFYKGSSNTGTHFGNLWSATGTKLASVQFTNESASGWQQANFSSPVAISANTTYIISYYAPSGGYAYDSSYFATRSVTNGPLTALQEGTDGPNGLYLYGGGFPNQSYNSSNYWIDVVFSSGSTTSDTQAPTAPASLRLNGTAAATSVPLTWNASADNVGVTKYNVLRGGVVIAQVNSPTLSYTDNTVTASTAYSYTVQAVDAAGNTSANSNTLNVTTPTPPPDSTPPTAFTLSLVSSSTTQINISWSSSTDPESGIKGYDVYRDGVKQNTTMLSNTTTSFGQTGSFTAGQTYSYLVKAANGSSSTNTAQTTRDSNSLAVTIAGAGSVCTLNATTSNFATVFSGAGAGAVICLGAGHYTNGTDSQGRSILNITAQKPGTVTLKPAPGLSASQVTMSVVMNNATNITIDGVKLTDGKPDNVDPGQPGQACTTSTVVPGGSCGVQGDAGQLISGVISGSNTKNVIIKNNDIPGRLSVRDAASTTGTNILIEGNLFHDFNANGCGGCQEGRLSMYKADNVTIQNNTMIKGRSDGIQVWGNNVKIYGNTFKDFVEGVSDGVHTDGIQIVNGESSNSHIKGNFVYNLSQSIAGFDRVDRAIFEDNVVVTDGRPYAIEMLSDNGSIIRHNTLVNFSTTGGCYWEEACGIIRLGNKSGDPASTGTVLKDNIVSSYGLYSNAGGGGGTGISPSNQSNNLFALAAGTSGHSEFIYSAGDIRGNPTFVGGARPTTYEGFALASGSLGKANASDGLDRGVRFSATPAPGPKVGDLDGDTFVTGHDLSLLLSKFNTTYAPYDIDGAPPITGHDLSLLLANFGK